MQFKVAMVATCLNDLCQNANKAIVVPSTDIGEAYTYPGRLFCKGCNNEMWPELKEQVE